MLICIYFDFSSLRWLGTILVGIPRLVIPVAGTLVLVTLAVAAAAGPAEAGPAATAHPAEAVAEAVDGETKRRLALQALTAVPVYISIVLVPAVRTIYLPVLWLQLLLLLLEGVAMVPL